MRIFGSLTDCECGCDIPKKPSEGGPLTAKKENLVADECCGGTTDECCKEEDEPDTRPGLWARYLERLNKATGGQLPKCH